jgi:CheY-like chemotaxis protein
MQRHESISILLVEDNDGHAKLIERNLRKVNLLNPIVRAADGVEALEYLGGLRPTIITPPPPPRLVLLDIDMPRMDGIEVLSRIKSDDRLRKTPVIMLTSTDSQAEIDRCYQSGANGYVAKPVNIANLGEKLRRLGLFLEIVELPAVA